MSEWKQISMEMWTCPKCGKESKMRITTKRKVCKECGAVFEKCEEEVALE